MDRADLHRLVDELPDESIDAAAVVLERARNPLWATLEAAPVDDEPLASEDFASIRDGRGQPGLTPRELRQESS